MKKVFLLAFSIVSYIGYSQSANLAGYVNPFIGTGGHGHTFPGATVPFGMVQLSPDTRIDGSWDGCSGYHYSDGTIYGFSHTHLNGTGCSDYGDIMLMPTMGEPSLDLKDYSSAFKHASEKASAGYYSVVLDDDAIKAEFTTTARVGLHQYTFTKKGQGNIIIDLNHRDKLIMGEVRVIDDKTIEVMRRSQAWAKDQYIFARIEFSSPMKITKVNNNAFAPAKVTDKFFAGSLLALSFSKQVKQGEKLLVKVSLSPTGYEGAVKNTAEMPKADFKKVLKSAEASWNKELHKIEITETDKDKLAVFYTALYHTMMQPNIAMDVDGMYRGRDNELHKAVGFDYYSVFSLWDTFRAANPLYTLIDKKRVSDFINTFLKQYEQGGRLPVWELASNETDCMIGYHSVSVMADAMVKGIKGFDYDKALEAAKHSAMLDHLGLDAYKQNGYISIDDEHESVSKTLEYAYDDWCIAQMALLQDRHDDYKYFMQRSQSWRNLLDPETKNMRPRKNGGWDKPFDAREVNNNFTEGNSWQYSFFVPQDVPGLIEALGGEKAFAAKLDEMFNAPSATTGRDQADVTGLIGQYAHGNEPSHHMAYLYTFVRQPEKTQKQVHYILDNFYKNEPDGLIGNEDCGQMSAWYVLSSMGMYQVTPGIPKWIETKPYFKKIKINFEDGTSKVITDDMPLNELTSIGMDNAHKMPQAPVEQLIPVPSIESVQRSFTDKLEVTLKGYEAGDKLFYMVTGGEQGVVKGGRPAFRPYTGPVTITATATITAYAERNGVKSKPAMANFVKKANNYTVSLKSSYDKSYHAGGPEGLIDGIFGSENWRKGDWQGYQGQDFEAVIDLQKVMPVNSVSGTFLQDSGAWILMPVKVEYYVSDDNSSFKLVQTVDNTINPQDRTTQVKSFDAKLSNVKGRYVKVKAYNFGKLPEWHQGAGGQAYIFVDEVTVK